MSDFANIRHDGAREALQQAITDLTTSDGWARWLECRAKFHRYSFYNTLLICAQRPDATQVAGYKKWPELGRHVRRGEKGIAILAPMVKKMTDADTGEESRRVFGFKAVHVFDVAQTAGEDLPQAPCQLLADDDEQLQAIVLQGQLLELAKREGLQVETCDTGNGANGYLDRQGRRIVLAPDRSTLQTTKTLAHELGHWFDPDAPTGLAYQMHRGEAETVAEAVAYIVARANNLDTSAYSVGYVATWANGDASAVTKLAERIDHAATAILKGCEQPARQEVAA